MGNLFYNLESCVSPSHTALVMINVALRRNTLRSDIVDRVRSVIDAARASMIMVIYLEVPAASASPDVLVGENQKIDSDLERNGLQTTDGLMPLPGDLVVSESQLSSACAKLGVVLRTRATRTAVLVGMETHESVLNIAHIMRAMDYRAVAVDDCVDSWNADLHRQTRLLMRNVLDHVVSSKVLASIWKEHGRSQITSGFVSPLGF